MTDDWGQEQWSALQGIRADLDNIKDELKIANLVAYMGLDEARHADRALDEVERLMGFRDS